MLTFIAFIIFLVLYIQLSNRIKVLEEKVNMAKGLPQIPTVPQAPIQQPMPQQQAAYIPPQPVVARETIPVQPAPVQAAAIPMPQPQQAFTPKADDGHTLEYKFGSQIFTIVGALAVIIGIAFFLTYAFQTGLISESARVVLGIIAGIALAGLGYWLSKKYTTYGQTLIGTGIGLLYLSVYSAYNFYHFISQGGAMVFMLIITALGVGLALLTDSMTLAAFAGIGGFLTPFLISGVSGDILGLFSYIFVLDIGIVVIAFYRLWRPLVFGSFIATAIVFLSWLATAFQTSMWLETEIVLAVFFCIFLLVSIIHYWRQKAPEDEMDLSLVIANPLAFFAASYFVIGSFQPDFLGLFTVLLGIVYIALWLSVRKEGDRDIRFRSFLAGVGFVLFVIAVPIQFHKFVITIAWAAEALVLMALGLNLRSKALKTGSQLLYMFVFLRLLLLDSQIPVDVPFLNTRFITIALSLISFIIAYALLYRREDKTEQDQSLLSFMMIEIAVVFVAGFSIDIAQFFSATALTFFWILAVALIAFTGFSIQSKAARILSFGLLFLTVFRFLFVHTYLGPNEIPFLNLRFVLLLITILVSGGMSLMYRRSDFGTERTYGRNILLVEMYILAQLLFTLEINDFFKSYWLTVAWSVVAVAAYALGVSVKNRSLRVLVYCTYVITILKLLVSDIIVARADYIPFFNSRILTFGVVALSLFVTAYLLYKNREIATPDEVSVVGWMGVIANIVLLIGLSTEIIQYFDEQMVLATTAAITTLENIKRVALSLMWIGYSVVLLAVGITKASSKIRVMGIVLIAITVFKVFLYDTAELDNFYRFVSYISLGIILLLTGYLYNRYKERILKFIVAR